MAGKRNRKIVRYRKPIQLNIGIIVFGIIFIYMLYFVFSYFTTSHVSAYEVTKGSIAQNTVFDGLILRDETVYEAAASGYVNYYCKAGTKASVGSYVYSVDETGDFYHQMTDTNNGQLMISDEAYRQLEAVADQYMSGYSDNQFYQMYQLRYDMEAALVEALNDNARAGIDQALGSTQGLTAYKAEAAGVVVYYTDGLESVTADTFTADMFDAASYKKENFLKREKIAAGDPAYKIINSEIWNVVIPLKEDLAKELREEENIQVEFKKDNTRVWAVAKIVERDGQPYLVLEFKNSMVRFANDRFVELELLLADTSGLKIPNTAITQKDFITVPKEYITKGGDSNKDGLLIERKTEDGKTLTPSFYQATLFYETEDSYYISSDEIRLGDVAIKPDSNERYVLKNTEVLPGVYSINRGYAVFRRIEKKFENEEYTIIKSGTSYGISMYDHIALDSRSIKENEIIK